jgi:tetratricopeptide (TPR) repeat protein
MPEVNGRVLPFRARRAPQASSAEQSRAAARTFLATAREDRTDEVTESVLTDADAFLAVCAEIKDRCDAEPAAIWEEARTFYCWLKDSQKSLGLFDERDYFLGECALTAGNAARHLGKRDEAEIWFDRAEASFRHTVNPAPLLANVSYARLTLSYDKRQYERVFESAPSLGESFRRLNMSRERLKCDFLEAMTLKESSRPAEALAKLQGMRVEEGLAAEPRMEAFVMLHTGELLSSSGRHAEAVACLKQVAAREAVQTQPLLSAHLHTAMAVAFREQGMLSQAAGAFRGAAEQYAAAGMSTLEAYLRIVLAETLIALSRHREAEWQIAAALPTIEEQGMVPEGFAAVTLLRESVRRRQADGNALRELREHLQAKN